MASTTIVKKSAKTIDPSSPFASLLRRSRFASFDPTIRQTYRTPPEAAHRGDYGLKRPLLSARTRRKNAFIALPAPFDSRAQYIEWENAENEVRFIRRFEEMEVSPRLPTAGAGVLARQGKGKTSWEETLGAKNSTTWVVDSEFGFEEEGVEVEEMFRKRNDDDGGVDLTRLQRTEQTQKAAPVDENLLAFGRRGPGAYGARRGLLEEASKVRLMPNIYAMSPREFTRYVRKLRELRPKFAEYVQKTWEAQQERIASDPFSRKSDAETEQEEAPDLLTAAQTRFQHHHIHFLESHTAESFADPESTAIEQRPHQVGGLLYARLSPLHSELHAQPQPGIVLQKARKDLSSLYTKENENVYIASLGGMTPIIRKKDWAGKRALMDNLSATGNIDRNLLPSSLANMRLTPGSVILEQVPRTVGAPGWTAGLSSASVSSEATVKTEDFGRDNPYMPGTPAYSGLQKSERRTSKDLVYSVEQERDDMRVELKKTRMNAEFARRIATPKRARDQLTGTLNRILAPATKGSGKF
ncbi:hypothetical protein V5O48_018913 [Marasmius crinis-equi]|uniref:Uncharacterized protein n=1 Tax=Marasmius crinis-equi TaxID=585013 RepID=A0ABR3EJU4_9AGAR